MNPNNPHYSIHLMNQNLPVKVRFKMRHFFKRRDILESKAGLEIHGDGHSRRVYDRKQGRYIGDLNEGLKALFSKAAA